jgi:hypothetical protein
MERVRIFYDFVRFSLIVLFGYTKDIVTKMNLDDSKPEEDQDGLLAVIISGEPMLVISRNTGLDDTHLPVMQETSLRLVECFQKEAAIAERIADSNKSMIPASELLPADIQVRPRRPEFWVLSGRNPGEIILGRRAIDNATAYIWEYNLTEHPVSEEGWKFAGASTQSRWYMSGLESGKCIWFRCCGVTREGVTAWSEPVFKVIP